ncbi:MAG: S9 family peptidase [Anaerolineales bacterium]
MTSPYTFDQFTAVHNFMDLTFSPDGEWVAYASNVSGQFNIWKQRVEENAHGPFMPIQLTALTDSALLRAAWSPDGKRIITMADFQGYELHQLYEIPAEKGWLYPLTHAHEVRHELARQPFSPNGRFVTYAANERNPREFDVVVRDLESGETRTLLAENGIYYPDSWSADGRYILASTLGEAANNNLYLCEVHEGTRKLLTPHQGNVLFTPGPWSPQGTGFYFLSNQEKEFTGLAYYDLRTGNTTWVENPDWDVQGVDLSSDGKYLAWVVNEGGYSRIYLKNQVTQKIKEFRDLPKGVIKKILFSPTNSLLGLYLSRAVRPADLYMLDVESEKFWGLTQSFIGGIPESEMAEPELVQYPSHDGLQIPAFLYKPKTWDGKPGPVVIAIHGGPEAQELPTYTGSNGFYQYLLHLGIGVFAPNIRGSTGYGKSYQQRIHRDWGGAELDDLACGFRYLQGLEWVDPSRIGLFGASFGGFEVLSCISRLAEYPWAAAVAISGPSNLITFTQTVPAFARQYMKETVGDPESEADFLRTRSPITYVQNIKTPLLVIQGANDPRVPPTESEQIVSHLRHSGQEVEYLFVEGEGHMFAKTTNWLRILRTSAEWFQMYLLR